MKFEPDQIIPKLIEVRKNLLEAASSLSPEDLDRIFLGVWSVKDLLAHLVGWDYTNLKSVQEIRSGQHPSVYSHYDHDWQTYNAGLVEQYKREDIGEMHALVQQSHRELINFLESLPIAEFDRDRGLRSRWNRVTIAWCLRFEIYDEIRHSEQIKKFADK